MILWGESLDNALGWQGIKRVSQLGFLGIKHGLHASITLRFSVNTSEVSIKVGDKLIGLAENEHATEGAEHLLLAIVVLNFGKYELGLFLLISTELDLTIAVTNLVYGLDELTWELFQLCLICHLLSLKIYKKYYFNY